MKNISIVKGTGVGSEQAMYIKEGGGKWNCQNIYVNGFAKGVKISATDVPSNDNITNGFVTFNPIQFVDTPIVSEYAGTNTTYVTQGNNTGAGNSAGTPSWATGWTVGM